MNCAESSQWQTQLMDPTEDSQALMLSVGGEATARTSKSVFCFDEESGQRGDADEDDFVLRLKEFGDFFEEVYRGDGDPAMARSAADKCR
jgi:hypothetical protein